MKTTATPKTGTETLLNIRTAFLLALSISLLMNILFLIMFFFGRPPMNGSERFHVFRLDITLMRFSANFAIAFLLYILNFRLVATKWFQTRQGKVRFVLIIVISTLILSFICSLVQNPLEIFPRQSAGGMFFGGVLRDFTIAAVVTLSSLLMYIAEKQQKIALENERLQAEYMKTRFMAIRNQVDPHFLFNSLNTLNSLIKIDSSRAEEYLQQLSYVFRYALQNKEIVTLEDELKFTRAYSNMMQIRYKDSLTFDYRVDEKYFACSVIPISLQTLVENAIKHNIVSNRHPLNITIATTDKYTIKVSNPVQSKKEPESGEGIGLTNLAERYRLLWNSEITIRDDNSVFEVEIPLIQ